MPKAIYRAKTFWKILAAIAAIAGAIFVIVAWGDKIVSWFKRLFGCKSAETECVCTDEDCESCECTCEDCACDCDCELKEEPVAEEAPAEAPVQADESDFQN